MFKKRYILLLRVSTKVISNFNNLLYAQLMPHSLTLILAANPNKVATLVLWTGLLFATWLIHSLHPSEAIKASLYQQELIQMAPCRGVCRIAA